MELSVRKDATIEEVLGFALWTYWQDKWEPRIDESREELLSAIGWVLRIAEEDGEVDEDFPPPDRMGKISKFSFDAYAVLEASPAQIQQNKILEAKIQRSPSRVVKKKPDPAPSLTAPTASSSATLPSTPNVSLMPSSFGPSSSFGPQMFLRIRVQDTLDAVHVYSTIPVTATMYLQEALDMVCARRKLSSKDYSLVVGDMSVLVALDRTVASLMGKSDLLLVKKEMVNNLGVEVAQPAGTSSDPNSSIFGGKAGAPEPAVSEAPDFTAAYKRFTVYRKMPMLVGRHERILAIDGAYIHFMPSNKAKAVFESGKTSSHHIKSVVSCAQADKSSATFRIVVHRVSRDGGNKRYEFEAENPASAYEIVATIKSLKSSIDRQSTIKARRSKHIG
ncbi:stress-activated map kinase interacting protein 1-domain-containing protein [Vararia minispora EC-137]|uniref:Stress-activated map kinase interacting protein 1-domain-containing protein n=1 Tax=Vararia minispora EC-137 TaxID=1314806 RepID=A0ACB8QF82_9AGAM|nr:stress-activated map kinase interacting protein 1-domain-containing protein [Vararia minispora EC-137]